MAGPAPWHDHRDGALHGGLARRPAVWMPPGVVVGAAVRVFALRGRDVFRALNAALPLPLGIWRPHPTA